MPQINRGTDPHHALNYAMFILYCIPENQMVNYTPIKTFFKIIMLHTWNQYNARCQLYYSMYKSINK